MTTEILNLTEMTSSQADKYVTFNTGLRQLEARLVRVLEVRTSAPPAGNDGDTYIVGAGSISGAWAAFSLNQIAHKIAGAWYSVTPRSGWSVRNIATDKRIYFNGTNWVNETEVNAGISAMPDGRIPFVASAALTSDADLTYTSATDTLNTKNLSLSLTDNAASPVNIVEGSNIYFRIATTNGSEKITFGNATTNPSVDFVGSGTVNLGAGGTSGFINLGTGTFTGNNTTTWKFTAGNSAQSIQFRNSADTVTRLGIDTQNGLVSISGNLSLGVATTITSATTLNQASSVRYIRCDDSSGSFTITLPAAASSAGIEYSFIKINSSTANQVTIDANGAETIDGNLSLILYTQNNNLTIWCDGTAWRVKDHFASGSFTPTLVGGTTPGTHTYGTQLGNFVRIKNQVNFSLVMTVTTKDAAMAGNVQIGGLPFTYTDPLGSSIANCGVSSYRQINISAGYAQIGGSLTNGSSVIVLRESGDNVNFLNVDSVNINSGFNISLSGYYFV